MPQCRVMKPIRSRLNSYRTELRLRRAPPLGCAAFLSQATGGPPLRTMVRKRPRHRLRLPQQQDFLAAFAGLEKVGILVLCHPVMLHDTLDEIATLATHRGPFCSFVDCCGGCIQIDEIL